MLNILRINKKKHMRNGDDNKMDVKNGRVTPASNSKSLNNE